MNAPFNPQVLLSLRSPAFIIECSPVEINSVCRMTEAEASKLRKVDIRFIEKPINISEADYEAAKRNMIANVFKAAVDGIKRGVGRHVTTDSLFMDFDKLYHYDVDKYRSDCNIAKSISITFDVCGNAVNKAWMRLNAANSTVDPIYYCMLANPRIPT